MGQMYKSEHKIGPLKKTLTNFLVKDIYYYVYEDDDIYTEAGIPFSINLNTD